MHPPIKKWMTDIMEHIIHKTNALRTVLKMKYNNKSEILACTLLPAITTGAHKLVVTTEK